MKNTTNTFLLVNISLLILLFIFIISLPGGLTPEFRDRIIGVFAISIYGSCFAGFVIGIKEKRLGIKKAIPGLVGNGIMTGFFIAIFVYLILEVEK